ncbi:MAG: glutamate carboxypeptidase [Gaiellaceae bacterium]|nr:glutamate carboxypeptidase [Gaiellaceae bacterium]
MLRLLGELVELESPTGSTGAMQARMAEELRAAGADVSLQGEHVRADVAGDGAPLLLLGHLDTVWPVGALARLPFRVEDGRAYGPGTYDMKAGLVILLAALSGSEPQSRRPLRVFLTADEEIGSPTARALLDDAAEGAAAAFVLEPPLPNGDLKTARKGQGRFRLTVQGRAAHAGTAAADGASAIEEAARQVLRIHALTDEARGIALNVGVIHGGTADNVVAAEAEALIDARVVHAADTAVVEAALRALKPELSGTSLTVDGGWTRPPLEPTPRSLALFAKAREYGLELGLDLGHGSSGGGSDGNLVAVLGVPVLDGLGAEGAGAHAADEHILINSLPVRANLLAALLRDRGL